MLITRLVLIIKYICICLYIYSLVLLVIEYISNIFSSTNYCHTYVYMNDIMDYICNIYICTYMEYVLEMEKKKKALYGRNSSKLETRKPKFLLHPF